jgi:hypothetical protein
MRPLLTVLVVAFVAAGCRFLATIPEGPQACHDVYTTHRCLAMADIVAADAGKDRGDVTRLAVIPEAPRNEALGGASPIRVRAEFADGTTHEAGMCGGIPWGPACSDEPSLAFRSAISSYTDVPAGSTPLPSLAPAAVKSASPIVIDSLTIPIDRRGENEIVLGRGSLPNGVWRTGSLDFADSWPDDVALRDGVVSLELHSLESDGKPFENHYLHGWRAGVERFEAILRFDVLWFEPGAVLGIRDVVVR